MLDANNKGRIHVSVIAVGWGYLVAATLEVGFATKTPLADMGLPGSAFLALSPQYVANNGLETCEAQLWRPRSTNAHIHMPCPVTSRQGLNVAWEASCAALCDDVIPCG